MHQAARSGGPCSQLHGQGTHVGGGVLAGALVIGDMIVLSCSHASAALCTAATARG